MTLENIRDEIRLVTGAENTSIVADTVINSLINKGQTVLADEANLTITVGT